MVQLILVIVVVVVVGGVLAFVPVLVAAVSPLVACVNVIFCDGGGNVVLVFMLLMPFLHRCLVSLLLLLCSLS